MNKKTVFIVMFVIIFTMSSTFTGTLVMVKMGKLDFITLNKTGNAKLDKMYQVKGILKNEFYEKVDDNVLFEGAIAGMADSLKDPYTVYFTKEQMEEFNKRTNDTEENYVGIGVQVDMDQNGLLTVIEPFEKSPAKEIGILCGDKIVEVDGKDVTTIRDDKMIISMIKGPEGTKVKIKVFRPSVSKTLEYEVERKKITIVLNIKSEIIDNNIGYIRMSMFDHEIAKNFKLELKKLREKNIKGLVIDLRNNPGGLMNEVVEIADFLLPKGVIVSTENRYKTIEKKESDENELDIPFDIIVNGNSASASEILSGASQDMGKALIIGTKTFGKGLVQEVKEFDDKSGLKITIARYFTPKGVCIHGKGIKPDIEVKNDVKYDEIPISLIPREQDLQLKRAVEEVTKKIKG